MIKGYNSSTMEGDKIMAITKDIRKHLGVVTSTIRGRKEGDTWLKEVNLVSWNGNAPKIDIRDWDENHERCGKGITLTESEAREVMEILQKYFAK